MIEQYRTSKLLFRIFAVIISIFNYHCDNSTEAPTITGTLSGIAILMDDYYDYHDNIKVCFENPHYIDSTFTDSLGNWSMVELPQGTYNVTFSKPGYGVNKLFGYSFVGGGNSFLCYEGDQYNQLEYQSLYIPQLYKMPVILTISELILESVNDRSIQVTVVLPDTVHEYNYDIYYYFGDAESVSKKDYIEYYRSLRTLYGSSQMSEPIYSNYLYNLDFSSGKTYYLIAYISGIGSFYYDPILDTKIHTTMSDYGSNVLKIQIP